MRTIQDMHRAIGVETTPVHRADGQRSDRAFLLNGVHVAVAGFWRALVALLFARFRGVIIRDRGMHPSDGGPRVPVVVMDWETYSRMLLGLRAERLPDIGMTGTAKELAANEAHDAEMGAF